MRYLIVVLGLLALMLAPVAVAAGHAPSLDAATTAHGHDHGPSGDAAAQPHGAQAHDGSDHDHPLTALLPRGAARAVLPSSGGWRALDATRGGGLSEGFLRPPRSMSARPLPG